MSIRKFIFTERKKLLASLLVGSFFLYFWVNGPLRVTQQIISLEKTENIFYVSKLVENEKTKQARSFNTINDGSAKGFGYGLILDKKTLPPSFGLLATQKNNPGLSKEVAKKILAHSKSVLSDTNKVELKSSLAMYYALAGTEIGQREIYLESKGVIQNIKGYAGTINVGVVLHENGNIVSVNHISSKETASYLRKIQQAGFYDQFAKYNLSSGAQEVDGVSGATITSEAIARTLTSLTQEATPYPLSDYVETGGIQTFSVEAVLSNSWIIHISVIFLLFFYGIQKKWKKSKKGVTILQILSVVYIGFFLNNSFTYVSFIHPFIGTSVSSLVGLYAFFTLMGAIWGRNTYCKYVCPFGNAQRLLLKISPQKSTRFFITPKWINRLRGALTLVLIAGVLLGLRNWSNYELFPDLFAVEWASLWFFIAFAIIAINIRYPLIWCRLLCPTGSVLDMLSDLVKKK